ncbi:hypothetical protein [Arcobacter aquimarinus]|uniref:Uncharacterized protein n=1 Tax=Arcobacter aquimarinus TaxID=1315211 RepID=A0AAE7E168_9BACT|nr:hypothetical protein [Arcobacter aquimarinus]QKE25612.1 hypothetical protein AAQM_0849 [Arcobacter aquimarinus]RXI30506.1 hypothetical protein CP986_11900 [Arcobacter aquimarinus]
MKTILLICLFLTNILFANYSYTNKNSGKIDMHGGKGENLLNQKNSLSNTNFKDIGVLKPVAPKAPEKLIKEEKKEKKEITK